MKAKTKSRLIKVLCVLMGAVFAIFVGQTFSALSINKTEYNNPNSVSAYTAKQAYSVINDTLSNPIPFGVGAHNYEVAIEYSYSYDFDIRIKYSLNWTNSKNTNNVILNYANRDNFIVDEEYIYVRDAVSNQSDTANNKGKLTIFTGVDFVNPEDSEYIGESLTIHIEEVKIYKATDSYTTSHKLYLDTPSGVAWLKYKNNSEISGAYAMVYNYRSGTASDLSRGIDFPGAESAYYKEVSVDQNSGYTAVTAAKWLGGQKFYAGIGVYIITGNSAITLKAKPIGSWLGDTASAQFDNNIRFNFAKDWKYTQTNATSYDNSTFLSNQEGYYTLNVPANSAVYIEILDSIEITSVGVLAPKEVNDIKLIAGLILNDVSFTSGDFLQVGTIASAGIISSNIAGTYAQSSYDIINTTNYNNGLYDFTNGSLTESYSQTFVSHISLTNNTANKIIPTITYSLRYYISNGSTTINVADNPSDVVLSSPYWYRQVGTTTSYINVSRLNNYDYIAPYSSREIVVSYTISSAFKSYIESTYGNYDVWVEIVPNVNVATTTNTTSKLDAQTSVNNQTITFSVKNNTAETISGTISADLELLKTGYDYVSVNAEPADWLANYWRYYYLSGGQYQKYTSATVTSGENTISSFDADNCYILYITRNSELVEISNETLFNGFVKDGSYTSSTLTLQPGESAKILSAEISSEDVMDMLTLRATVTATSSSVANSIDLVNENNEYVTNSSIKVSNNLLDITKLEDGALTDSDGKDSTTTNRVRTTFLYLEKGVYQTTSISPVRLRTVVHKYSEANQSSYIASVEARYKLTNNTCVSTFIVDEDCYVRFAFYPTSSTTTISVDNILEYNPTLIKINNYAREEMFENGSILSADGQNSDTTNRVRTKFIYLEPGDYVLGLELSLTSPRLHKYAEDEQSSWISQNVFSTSTSNTMKYYSFTITEACYIRFIISPADTSGITDLSVDNISQYDVFLIKSENFANRNAYIVNNSENSYYVRFTGVYNGNDENIVNINGWNYYIGIVKPNQILNLPMSTSGKINVLEAGEEFSTADMTWSDALELFNSYYD